MSSNIFTFRPSKDKLLPFEKRFSKRETTVRKWTFVRDPEPDSINKSKDSTKSSVESRSENSFVSKIPVPVVLKGIALPSSTPEESEGSSDLNSDPDPPSTNTESDINIGSLQPRTKQTVQTQDDNQSGSSDHCTLNSTFTVPESNQSEIRRSPRKTSQESDVNSTFTVSEPEISDQSGIRRSPRKRVQTCKTKKNDVNSTFTLTELEISNQSELRRSPRKRTKGNDVDSDFTMSEEEKIDQSEVKRSRKRPCQIEENDSRTTDNVATPTKISKKTSVHSSRLELNKQTTDINGTITTHGNTSIKTSHTNSGNSLESDYINRDSPRRSSRLNINVSSPRKSVSEKLLSSPRQIARKSASQDVVISQGKSPKLNVFSPKESVTDESSPSKHSKSKHKIVLHTNSVDAELTNSPRRSSRIHSVVLSGRESDLAAAMEAKVEANAVTVSPNKSLRNKSNLVLHTVSPLKIPDGPEEIEVGVETHEASQSVEFKDYQISDDRIEITSKENKVIGRERNAKKNTSNKTSATMVRKEQGQSESNKAESGKNKMTDKNKVQNSKSTQLHKVQEKSEISNQILLNVERSQEIVNKAIDLPTEMNKGKHVSTAINPVDISHNNVWTRTNKSKHEELVRVTRNSSHLKGPSPDQNGEESEDLTEDHHVFSESQDENGKSSQEDIFNTTEENIATTYISNNIVSESRTKGKSSSKKLPVQHEKQNHKESVPMDIYDYENVQQTITSAGSSRKEISHRTDHIQDNNREISHRTDHIQDNRREISPRTDNSQDYRREKSLRKHHIQDNSRELSPRADHIQKNSREISPSTDHIQNNSREISPSINHVQANSREALPDIEHDNIPTDDELQVDRGQHSTKDKPVELESILVTSDTPRRKTKEKVGKKKVRIVSDETDSVNQEQTIKMWKGHDENRTSRDVIDLDVVLDRVTGIIEEHRSACGNSSGKKALNSLLVYTRKEITDMINKIENVKSEKRDLSGTRKDVKSMRERLMQLQHERISLEKQIKAKKEEGKSTLEYINHWFIGMTKLISVNKNTKSPREVKYMTYGNFPIDISM